MNYFHYLHHNLLCHIKCLFSTCHCIRVLGCDKQSGKWIWKMVCDKDVVQNALVSIVLHGSVYFCFVTIFYHGKILSRFFTGKKSNFLPVKNPFYITSPFRHANYSYSLFCLQKSNSMCCVWWVAQIMLQYWK